MGRRSSNYPPELRERAIRMVAEVRQKYPLDWPAIVAVAAKLGIGTAETLRKWVRQFGGTDVGRLDHDDALDLVGIPIASPVRNRSAE